MKTIDRIADLSGAIFILAFIGLLGFLTYVAVLVAWWIPLVLWAVVGLIFICLRLAE